MYVFKAWNETHSVVVHGALKNIAPLVTLFFYFGSGRLFERDADAFLNKYGYFAKTRTSF